MQILRAAIVGLAALIAALLLPSANASAVPADIRLVDGYTYDADCHAAHTANTGSESGPPLGAGRYASHIAVGHRSRGSSAHADAEPGYVDTTYDVSALPVPSDNATTTTAEPADLIDGTVSSLQGWRVAAKSEHSLLARARMDRRLNPERGSIGGGGFTGSATTHGAERMAEAGFDNLDVAIIRAGRQFEQTDGATAFVSSAGKDTYNMIIQNSDGAIVTAHRGMTYDDLAGLAQNYGWSGW